MRPKTDKMAIVKLAYLPLKGLEHHSVQVTSGCQLTCGFACVVLQVAEMVQHLEICPILGVACSAYAQRPHLLQV